MILSCPPAVVDWNASEEMNADNASREVYCALLLEDVGRWRTAIRPD